MNDNLPLVKVISKTGNLPRQLPGSSCWGDLRFTFDREISRYDWLVVYDDIPAIKGGKISQERLGCAPENTILITHEPAAVKIHGSDFVNQFNYVLTCHEEWAMRHRNKVTMHPASPWWYKNNYCYDELKQTSPWKKTKQLSIICSDKQQAHTLHKKRYEFTKQLKQLLPSLEWFGFRIQDIADKSEGLDSYRYHIAVENHICPHYWSEKLADPFLAYCLPFYCGCPNAADYFPPESFIVIDINDTNKAAQIIKDAIADNAYEKRLPAIIEARRRVLEEHNFFAVASRFIAEHPHYSIGKAGGILYSRRALISKSPLTAIRYLWQKTQCHRKFKIQQQH